MNRLLPLVAGFKPTENPQRKMDDFSIQKLRSLYERARTDANKADLACGKEKSWKSHYSQWINNNVAEFCPIQYYCFTNNASCDYFSQTISGSEDCNKFMQDLLQKEIHLKQFTETCDRLSKIASQSLLEATLSKK